MPKNRIYIIAFTALIIIAICFFAIKPTISVALQSYRELKTSQDKLKASEEEKNAVNALADNTEQITTVKAIAESYIPEDPATSDLVMEITTIAGSNSIKILSTSMDQAKTAQKATTTSADETATKTTTTTPTPGASATPAASSKNLDFQLSVEGTFPNFLNFLKGLENGARLLTIKTIGFQVNLQDKTNSVEQIMMSGTAYYRPQVALTETLENIKVSADTIKKFLDLKGTSAPFSLPQGGGVGRGNPFEGY